ncbi:hypothetical protein [Ectopseudomonas guguanensis]|uniref:hypothetical protein n=1 Tax=Ectopseudomonas guguanensis TaxID=1198456 RepID=UPI00286552E6|nr:hypothetical protein [Pseudomonas guguanensis]MDR8015366.1 hypothetical protein [Pseudomonas guguanensis]
MKTTNLKGNLLNMYVALALGGKEGVDLRVPFDEWECGIAYKGCSFEPEKCTSLGWESIWPAVLRLKIGCVPDRDDLWLATMPDSAESHSVSFPPLLCLTPIDGYRIAIVWSVFGPEVPDTFKSCIFGTVDLLQYQA